MALTGIYVSVHLVFLVRTAGSVSIYFMLFIFSFLRLLNGVLQVTSLCLGGLLKANKVELYLRLTLCFLELIWNEVHATS